MSAGRPITLPATALVDRYLVSRPSRFAANFDPHHFCLGTGAAPSSGGGDGGRLAGRMLRMRSPRPRRARLPSSPGTRPSHFTVDCHLSFSDTGTCTAGGIIASVSRRMLRMRRTRSLCSRLPSSPGICLAAPLSFRRRPVIFSVRHVWARLWMVAGRVGLSTGDSLEFPETGMVLSVRMARSTAWGATDGAHRPRHRHTACRRTTRDGTFEMFAAIVRTAVQIDALGYGPLVDHFVFVLILTLTSQRYAADYDAGKTRDGGTATAVDKKMPTHSDAKVGHAAPAERSASSLSPSRVDRSLTGLFTVHSRRRRRSASSSQSESRSRSRSRSKSRDRRRRRRRGDVETAKDRSPSPRPSRFVPLVF